MLIQINYLVQRLVLGKLMIFLMFIPIFIKT